MSSHRPAVEAAASGIHTEARKQAVSLPVKPANTLLSGIGTTIFTVRAIESIAFQ